MKTFFLILFLLLNSYHLANCGVFSKKKLTETDVLKIKYLLVESQKFKHFKNYNESLRLLNEALVKEPKNAELNFQIADVYRYLNNYDKAVYYAKIAISYDKTNEYYLNFLASLYSNNEPKNAISIYSQLIDLFPSNIEYHIELASLFLESNQLRKAEKVISNVDNKMSFSPELFIIKYQIAFSKENYKNCLEIINNAIELYPDEPKFVELLALHYQSLNMVDSAIVYYQKIIEIEPSYEISYINLIEIFSKKNDKLAYQTTIQSMFNCRDISLEIKFPIIVTLIADKQNFQSHVVFVKSLIDTLLVQYPDSFKVKSVLADYFLKTNQFESAKNLLLELSKDKPESYIIWEQLLLSLSIVNDYPTIYSISENAFLLFPNQPIIHLYIGIAALQVKKYESALRYLKKGYSIVNDSTELKLKFSSFLGEAYNGLKDFAQSDTFFRKAIQMDAYNLLVLNNYSYYLSLRNENLDSALVYSKRCVTLEPKSNTYLDTYGWVLFKAGHITEARKAIENAIIYGGYKNEEILEHYIEILVAQNLHDEAMKYYKMILELGKDSERSKILLNIK